MKSFLTLVICLNLLVGCGNEDSVLKNQDLNSTKALDELSKATIQELEDQEFKPFQEGDELDMLLRQHIEKIIPAIRESMPEVPKFDYERLEHSFLKMLTQNNQAYKQKKFQFICDENERWIYRCNMDTGEIECFSMSSNKLRLLSSIK